MEGNESFEISGHGFRYGLWEMLSQTSAVSGAIVIAGQLDILPICGLVGPVTYPHPPFRAVPCSTPQNRTLNYISMDINWLLVFSLYLLVLIGVVIFLSNKSILLKFFVGLHLFRKISFNWSSISISISESIRFRTFVRIVTRKPLCLETRANLAFQIWKVFYISYVRICGSISK